MNEIEKFDSNFRLCKINVSDVCYYDILSDPFEINGLYKPKEIKKYMRMSEEVKNLDVNEGVKNLMYATSGGRVRFGTDSPYIVIKYVLDTVFRMMVVTGVAQSGFDLYMGEYGSRDLKFRHSFHPYDLYSDKDRYCDGFYNLNEQEHFDKKDIMLHFPLYSGIVKVEIGIKNGCKIFPPTPYKEKKPIVFYGSSITHGGCASRPGNTYPATLSRWLDCDFINLGFPGSAHGEKDLAEYIKKIDMSAFVLDYEANASSDSELLNTHNNFYKIIREYNKDLPIIMISFPRYPIYHKDENSMGRDPYNCRKIIYNNYLEGINNKDENLYFIDGETLFGGFHQDSCTIDYCHPNDLGFYRMSERIYPILKKALSK